MTKRKCDCGSGQYSMWQYDADGIELCRTCEVCHQKKMAKYRKDILTRSSRYYGEQVDDDY